MMGIPFGLIVLLWICCGRRCGCRCRRGRRLRFRNVFTMCLMLSIFLRFPGQGPWVPILACIAIGYFLRKIEETRSEDCCPEVSTEEMEEAAGDE